MNMKDKTEEIMIHYPSCYRDFSCTGSGCEFTCCGGWSISADQKSVECYKKIKGDFGKRLRSSVDKNGILAQTNGRCRLLNHENLCEIYIQLGKEHMCKTCRTYPRHVEVYGCLHEISLSLSCPAAAKLVLERTEPDVFLAKRKADGSGQLKCELDKGQRKLLKELLALREGMFSVMSTRELPIQLRMAMVLSLGHDAQRRLSTGESVKMLLQRYIGDKAADGFLKHLEEFMKTGSQERLKRRRDLMCVCLERCGQLHPVVADWKERMEHTAMLIYGTAAGDEQYEVWQKQVESESSFYPVYMEHLMNYFLYVYVLGAVYDGDLYSKVKLAVYSCLIVREMNIGGCARTGRFTQKDGVRNAYLYARELEHSDRNIEILERQLSGKYALGLTELFSCL